MELTMIKLPKFDLAKIKDLFSTMWDSYGPVIVIHGCDIIEAKLTAEYEERLEELNRHREAARAKMVPTDAEWKRPEKSESESDYSDESLAKDYAAIKAETD